MYLLIHGFHSEEKNAAVCAVVALAAPRQACLSWAARWSVHEICLPCYVFFGSAAWAARPSLPAVVPSSKEGSGRFFWIIVQGRSWLASQLVFVFLASNLSCALRSCHCPKMSSPDFVSCGRRSLLCHMRLSRGHKLCTLSFGGTTWLGPKSYTQWYFVGEAAELFLSLSWSHRRVISRLQFPPARHRSTKSGHAFVVHSILQEVVKWYVYSDMPTFF